MFKSAMNTAGAPEVVARNGTVGTVRMGCALAIPAVLRELGGDLRLVADRAGFHVAQFDDPESRAPVEAVARLLHECAVATGCQHFGLLVGQRTTTAALGRAGFVAKYSRDIGSALDSLVVNVPYLNSGLDLSLGRHGQVAIFGFALHHGGYEGAGHIEDAALAIAVTVVRELSDQHWHPDEVLLIHAKPADCLAYSRFFRAPVRFGADSNALVFDSRWMGHRIEHSDPALRDFLLREFRREMQAAPSLAEQVRHVMRPLMDARTCTAERVAGMMRMRVWTMNRRLADEGTSFRKIFDEVRFEMACRLLKDTSQSLADISERLGFEYPAAFTRAFRRWADKSPSEWRKAASRPAADGGRMSAAPPQTRAPVPLHDG
jgi:AraC-like DNA-binding protein